MVIEFKKKIMCLFELFADNKISLSHILLKNLAHTEKNKEIHNMMHYNITICILPFSASARCDVTFGSTSIATLLLSFLPVLPLKDMLSMTYVLNQT